MSTRCKACNSQLSHFDFTTTQEGTDIPEDLCQRCKVVAKNCDFLDTKEYAYAHITENWANFRNYNEKD